MAFDAAIALRILNNGRQRTALRVRSDVAIGAHENRPHLLSGAFDLNSRKASNPIAMLANMDPKQQLHGASVWRRKRSAVGYVAFLSADSSTVSI